VLTPFSMEQGNLKITVFVALNHKIHRQMLGSNQPHNSFALW